MTSRTSKLILQPLTFLFEMCFIEELMLKQNLLFERSSILSFNIRETGRHCTFVSLKVIVSHLQFAKLDLCSLIFLAEGVEFTLKRSCGRVVVGLK